jgi:hypothetical protein
MIDAASCSTATALLQTTGYRYCCHYWLAVQVYSVLVLLVASTLVVSVLDTGTSTTVVLVLHLLVLVQVYQRWLV